MLFCFCSFTEERDLIIEFIESFTDAGVINDGVINDVCFAIFLENASLMEIFHWC